ncbi:hypothetical protein IMCC26134_04595 [Verrucomicrobia bacterium IMCC26134]|nr:hypothetical protein IMCC26134_04595 [Verrucomicrobia bacterium IMCC26134]
MSRILTLVALLFAGVLGSARADTLPDTCYLFAYFYHDLEAEGFRLAWSADGRRFEKINEGRAWITPNAGENKLMRDPAICRGPDGVFHLVWTTGWTGRTIGYASSRDLIIWSEQKTLPVMMHETEAQNCWAPEILWDATKGHFLIHWSTTVLGRYPETEMSNRRPERNHRIYATTTKDFTVFTPTKLLYNAGYNVIDSNLIPARDGSTDWLLFVKDETLAPVTQKNIRMVRGRSPEGPWDPVSPALTGNYWAEGPTAIKVGDEYRVYFDKHMVNAIGLVSSTDLRTWIDRSDEVRMPENARHGSILAVERAVVERLLKHTGGPIK